MSESRIIVGDCRAELPNLPDCSVDAIVTDPPYELGFMGKAWDRSGVACNVDAWRECLRVLKPGGHLLAFGGARTYHRMACAIEDAGFEVRDQMMWIYGSGFPKSLDVSKAIDKMAGAQRVDAISGGHLGYARPAGDVSNEREFGNSVKHCIGKGSQSRGTAVTDSARRWDGWGTALKPSHEPICVARKPLAAGTVAANVLEYGCGVINVNACRVGNDGGCAGAGAGAGARVFGNGLNGAFAQPVAGLGRWPANVILDEEAAVLLDDMSGELTSGNNPAHRSAAKFDKVYSGGYTGQSDLVPARLSDKGGASRFFYTAKASSSERNSGDVNNSPPTVKPLDLMRYLVRLVTPPGGTVLDPFAGSGTTGCACVLEGFGCILIEREPEYAEIARARVAACQPVMSFEQEAAP